MRFVIYTANIGGRDQIREPECLLDDCEYYYFSDTPLSLTKWTNIIVPRQENPVLAARRIKILSHHFFPNADYVVWHDDARSFLVFRTGKGAYHVFMEMDAASVAKAAFSTTTGNTRAKWKKIWERV